MGGRGEGVQNTENPAYKEGFQIGVAVQEKNLWRSAWQYHFFIWSRDILP